MQADVYARGRAPVRACAKHSRMCAFPVYSLAYVRARLCVRANPRSRVQVCVRTRGCAYSASAHLLMHMRGCVFELVCLEWPEDLAHELIWHVHFLRELAHFCRRCRPPDCKLPVMPLPLLVVRRGPVRQAVMPSPCTESIHSARAPAPARPPGRPPAPAAAAAPAPAPTHAQHATHAGTPYTHAPRSSFGKDLPVAFRLSVGAERGLLNRSSLDSILKTVARVALRASVTYSEKSGDV